MEYSLRILMNESQQERNARFYEFGPFRVDSVKYVLTRDGEVAPLNLKAFEILLALIENRGQVLEKNELLQRVWPDTVVEENNLARNISALRKALDEHPNEHQYILTVPGRGYRFVATVKAAEYPAGLGQIGRGEPKAPQNGPQAARSEEHTSELQSLRHLVC